MAMARPIPPDAPVTSRALVVEFAACHESSLGDVFDRRLCGMASPLE